MKFIDQKIENYCLNKSTLPSHVCDELEKHTRENIPMSQMLVGKMEASFLGFLIKSIGVKRVLEIGTFTGYSALAMAEALPNNGTVTTLDISEESTKVAREYWSKSEVGHKIDLHIGPALESLDKLSPGFDLVFIDADKENYFNYLNKCLGLLSSRGIIVIDNVLWSGSVLKAPKTEATAGIQKLNDYVAGRKDLYSTLLPIRDGMLLIKRNQYE